MSEAEEDDDALDDDGIPEPTPDEAEALGLIPTQHLIFALQRRADASLVVLHKMLDPANETEHSRVYASGGYIAALGMIEYAKLRTLGYERKPTTHDD